MTSSMAIKSVAAMTLFMTQGAFGEEPPRKRVQAESTSLTQFGPNGTIRFTNSSGYLIVEGWDRQDVEVTVLKWIDHEFLAEQVAAATKRLQDISVSVEHPSAQELKISTAREKGKLRKGKGRVELKYHIYAPRDSRIAVDHHGGFILLSGLTGDIDVANRRGDIVLMLPAPASYAIDARNTFGIVTPDFTGTTKHKYVIGEQFARNGQAAAHRMRLRMGFGGITIKEVPPEGEPPAATSMK
jgi:hypothetical protein